MIRWALLSILATGLFWGLYRLLLGWDRWLQLSRVYLIFTLAFGLAYPLVKLPEEALPKEMHVMVLDEVMVSSNVGTDIPISQVSDSSSPTLNMIPFVYWAGVAVSVLVLLFSIRRIAMKLKGLSFNKNDEVKLALLDDDTEPFSFFKHIIIGTRAMNEEEVRLVVAHESEHVRQRHSVDMLLMRLMCCVAWFNPFAWLMLNELQAVHEYQADTAALGDKGNTIRPYLGLLYRQVTGFGYGHITNNFQSINLKKRIIMMKKQKTRFGAWKAVAALPVVALLLMVGCKNTEPAPSENTAPKEQAATTNEATVEPELFDPQTSAPEGFQAPEYPGGMEAFYKYLSENLQYPEQAKTNGVEGRVLINFVVMNNGDIINVDVAKGIGSGCDEEAVRVVKAMPKWKPAMNEGKPVNVQYALPISFKLQ